MNYLCMFTLCMYTYTYRYIHTSTCCIALIASGSGNGESRLMHPHMCLVVQSSRIAFILALRSIFRRRFILLTRGLTRGLYVAR